jgi:two-component system chemotaxis response regulator CheB
MARIELFVVGASAGGFEAWRAIVSKLSPDFPSCICLVVHLASDSPGMIPEIVQHYGPLPVRHARDGDELRAGSILVAPPNRHLLVTAEGRLMLGSGPKENRFRPAIDPLFRSAALALGSRAAGVILSGGLDDGAAGLLAIKRRGGATLVQDPHDAHAPSMPLAALRAVGEEAALALDRIAARMEALSRAYDRPKTEDDSMVPNLDKEVRVAAGKPSEPDDVLALGEPSLFTCPDCHGALVRVRETGINRFRCHTGHAYTAESLIGAMKERIEESLWSAIRSLEEYAFLQDRKAEEAHDDAVRKAASLAAEDAHQRALLVREVAQHECASSGSR